MRDGSSFVLSDRDEEEFGAELVKFTPDGKHVVASDPNGVLRLWAIRTSKLVRKWRAHEGRVLCVAFTPNGRGLVTGSSDHSLKYWDLHQPEFIEVLTFVGHKVCHFYTFFLYTVLMEGPNLLERGSFRCHFA